MQRASNNYHLCLREILPVLDFKVISRNLDCFGKYMTEYTDLNFSTVSLADHLLLPAVFLRALLWQHSQQPRRWRSSIRKVLSSNKPGPTLQPKWAGGACLGSLCRPPEDALQTPVWKSFDPSCLPQQKLLTHTSLNPILTSSILIFQCHHIQAHTAQSKASALLLPWSLTDHTPVSQALPYSIYKKKGDSMKPTTLLKAFLFFPGAKKKCNVSTQAQGCESYMWNKSTVLALALTVLPSLGQVT